MPAWNLSESDYEDIISHLRVAADVYRLHASEMRGRGQERLAEQFARQQTNANDIADRIEN